MIEKALHQFIVVLFPPPISLETDSEKFKFSRFSVTDQEKRDTQSKHTHTQKDTQASDTVFAFGPNE